jgi:hypothetical protein
VGTSYIRHNDDNVRFVLDQHSASSLVQQSAGVLVHWYNSLLVDIIQIIVFALTP